MAEANICTICQTDLYNGRDILTTSCKHTFHAQCILTNARMSDNKCPNCRTLIPSFDNQFTGYHGKTEKSKEKLISNQVCWFNRLLKYFTQFHLFCFQ
jgi:hypothetical protein